MIRSPVRLLKAATLQVALITAGCFSTTPPAAPCTSDDACPTDQHCAAAGECAAGRTLPPTAVVVTLTPGGPSISWTPAADASSATRYQILRSADGTTFAAVGSPVDAPPFVDATAKSGGAYYYAVQAIGSGGLASRSAASTPDHVGLAPTPPASAQLSLVGGVPVVAWTPAAGAPSGTTYAILRSSDAATFTQVGVANASPFTDTSASPGFNYFYEVAAISGGLSSTPIASAPTQVAVPVLPPSGVALARISGVLTLSWTAPSNADLGTRYRILRSADGVSFVDIGQVVVGSPFDDAGAPAGGISWYQVETLENDRISSAVAASPTHLAKAPAPPTLVDVALVSGSPQVTWTAPAGALPGIRYQVERSSDGSTFSTVATQDTSPFTDTTVDPGSAAFYRVSSVQNSLSSAPVASAPASALVPLLPPAQVALAIVAGAPTLTLTPPSNANAGTQYQVLRGPDGVNLAPFGAPTSATTVGDPTALAGAVYFYAVASVQGALNSAPLASAPPSIAVPPAVPTGATLTVSGGFPALSWTAPVGALQGIGYQVFRAAGSTPLPLGAPVSATTLQDTTAAPGTSYTYLVASVQNGASSALVAFKPASIAGPVLPPVNPVLTLNGASGPTISFAAPTNADVTTQYLISRGNDGVTFAPLFTQTGAAAYADTSAQAGGLYYYEVTTVEPGQAGTASHSSNPQLTTPPSVALPPAPPTAVTLSLQAGTPQLSWTAPANALSGIQYRLYRGISGQSLVAIGTLQSGSPYLDPTASPGTYDYGVQSVQNSLASAVVKAGPITVAPPLAAPASATLTAPSGTTLQIAFVPPSPAPAGATYQLLRGAGAANLAVLAGATVTVSPFLDTPPPGGTYSYAVETLVQGTVPAYSAPTKTSPASLQVVPGPVTGLVAGAPGCLSNPLSWQAPAGGADFYIISRTNAGATTTLATIPSTSLSYTDTDPTLQPGIAYSYSVAGKNGAGTGPLAQLPVTTPPPAPTWRDPNAGTTFVYAGDTQATMQWQLTSTDPTAVYALSRGTGAGALSPVKQFKRTGLNANVLSVTDTGLAQGTTYRYQLSLTSSAGTSCPTTVQTGTTTFGTSIQQSTPAQLFQVQEGTTLTTTFDLQPRPVRSQAVTANAVTTYPGAGAADGTFTVPNGAPNTNPTNQFAYGSKNSFPVFYNTSSHTFDLSIFSLGRAAAFASSPTPATFSVSGLAPWNASTDSIEGVALNLGLLPLVLQQSASAPPAAGATSASLTVDFLNYGVLYDQSQGDVFTLSYIANVPGASPFAYSALKKSCTAAFSPSTMVDGVATSVACQGGSFPAATPTQTTVNLARSQFKSAAVLSALIANGAQPDTADADTFQIGAYVKFPGGGLASGNGGTILTMNLDAAATDVSQPVTYLNPYGPQYQLVYLYTTVLAARSFNAPKTATCPAPTATQLKYGFNQQEPLRADGSLPAQIGPEVFPAVNVTVSALPPGPSGANVQVSWDEPLSGAHPPTIYAAYLWRLTSNATCGSDSTLVYRVRSVPGLGGVILPATAFPTLDGSGAYYIQVNTGWHPDELPNYAQPIFYAQAPRVVTAFTYSPQFTH